VLIEHDTRCDGRDDGADRDDRDRSSALGVAWVAGCGDAPARGGERLGRMAPGNGCRRDWGRGAIVVRDGDDAGRIGQGRGTSPADGRSAGVLRQAPVADVGDPGRYALDRRKRSGLDVGVRTEHLGRRFGLPRQVIGQHPIDQQAQRVDVGGGYHLPAGEPFRSEVGGRAADLAVLVGLRLTGDGGEAEIDHFRPVGVSMTFDGLTSRWTRPLAWAAASALATSAQIRKADRDGNGRLRAAETTYARATAP
jgi:hypothetical protein